MGRPVLKMLIGAGAGLLVWMVFEPMIPANPLSSRTDIVIAQMVFWLGGLIGLALGGFEGWQQGSRAHLIRGLLLGFVLGLVGASLGARMGNTLIAPFGGESALINPNVSIFIKIPIRILALAPLALFLGAGIGASTLNWKRAVQGAIGGLIGGGIGAALFDPISYALAPIAMSMQHVQQGQPAEIGVFGRVAYCLLMGAGIGLFIGIVENAAKVAWLRLSYGRNEGREWVVDAPQTILGRSETANVPLFGDPAIAPKHASIYRRGEEYVLVDEGSQSGTFLNGQRITQTPLFHGAVIQIGGVQLEFLMKIGSVPQRAAEALRSQGAFALQAATPYGAAPAAFYPGPAQGMPTQFAGPSQALSPPAQPMATPSFTAPATSGYTQAPVTARATDTLVAITGPLTGQRFPVSAALEIGRESSGISLNFDTSASRKHASVAPSPGGVILTDLGSTNGTFVNDQKIHAASLVKGDLVRIGITTFRVE